MKFIVGLLVGTLGVLAASSLVGFSWQPPTRLAAVPDSTVIGAEIQSDAEAPMSSSERLEAETDLEGTAESQPPVRSVTIAPLPADPAPRQAPSPLAPPDGSRAEVAQTQSLRPNTGSNQSPVALNASDDSETAVVWKPFHSEVSATGFARRLSVQLGYPFRALREGPAKYHVVFDYGSDEQRELLREQVKALTGFSVI